VLNRQPGARGDPRHHYVVSALIDAIVARARAAKRLAIERERRETWKRDRVEQSAARFAFIGRDGAPGFSAGL